MELIKITEQAGKQVVSARELYDFLEITTDFTTFFKRMFEYGFEENTDYTLLKIGELKNQHVIKYDYALTLDCAKEISMIQRSEKGKQARKYFLECERKLNKPLSRKEMAMLIIQQEEEKERLSKQVENLSQVLDSAADWVSIIKVAKHNKVHEKVFSWRKLKNKTIELGYHPKKVLSPRFDYMNLYHVNAFKALYPEFKYNFKDENNEMLGNL